MANLIAVPTFQDGQLVHQGDLATLCYDIDGLTQMGLGRPAVDAPSTKPICKIGLAAPWPAPTLASGTAVITWSREIVDTDDLWDPAFPDHLAIHTAGWYRITAQVLWPSAASGDRGLHILVNGVADPLNVVGSTNTVLPAAAGPCQQVIAYEHLAAGATVSVGVFQDSGTTLGLNSVGLWGTYLVAAWDAPY